MKKRLPASLPPTRHCEAPNRPKRRVGNEATSLWDEDMLSRTAAPIVIASIRPGYPGKNRDDVSLWEVRAKACQKSGPGVWRECPFSWFGM